MLDSELDKHYIVYPSWAEYSYAWRDLGRELSNPLHGKFAKLYSTWDWKSLGYTERVQPFELIDGAGGNGIIVIHIRRKEAWLPMSILHSEANILQPGVMTNVNADFRVQFLDPMYVPAIARQGRKPQRAYICAISAEHVESAGEDVFWVVGLTRGSRRRSRLVEVKRVAHGFGLGIAELGGCPQQLLNETEGWFANEDYEYSWFRISATNRGAGFHFAVVVYLGLHLKRFVGSTMHFMHLVAQIPGKPNVRKNMKHW